MKKLLLLLLFIPFLSCKPDADITSILANNNWVYYPFHEETTDLKDYEYVKFYDNGTYESYPYYNRNEADVPEKAEKKKWEYSPRTKKLFFLGGEYEVLSAKEDMLMLSKGDYKYILVNADKMTQRVN